MDVLMGGTMALWIRMRGGLRGMARGGRRAGRAVCGSVQWQPPAWMERGRGWCIACARNNPRRLWSGVGGVAIAAVVIGGGWYWWTHRPQPTFVTVTVVAPGITPIINEGHGEELRPEPLRITFSESVARLEAIGKPVTDGIVLAPATAGTWEWTDDRTLRFRPQQDWPAATRFTITTRRDVFAPNVKLETYSFHTETPAFSAGISSFSFYQDPVDPQLKKMVGTITFSHPVEMEGLEEQIRLESEAGTTPFTIQTDKFHRRAYVHSETLTLTPKDRFMQLRVGDKLRTTLGGARVAAAVERKATVPGLETFFRVEGIETQIVRNAEDDPEQVLIVRLRDGVKAKKFFDHLAVYTLPVRTAKNMGDTGDESDDADDESTADDARDDDNEEIPWESASEVTPEILTTAARVQCTPLPSAEEFNTFFSCRYQESPGTAIYVSVAKGLTSFGGFRLEEAATELVAAPAFPTELHFTPDGSLLALHGARRLSLQSRGIEKITLEFARILPDEVHDLAVESAGDFSAPEMSGSIDEENIAEIFSEQETLPTVDPARAHYTVVDLGKHLAARRGLFLMTARGWAPDDDDDSEDETDAEDSDGEDTEDAYDRRFVLVTDIGLLHKHLPDDSHLVFLYSLGGGGPIAGAQVAILAKNGLPIQTLTSDTHGMVTFTPLGTLRRERTPVVITAALGDDFAFLPFKKSDRELNFSNFDVDGEQLYGKQQLTASVFSDRGIYRPGELLHAGIVVKASEWQHTLAGVPLEVLIKDPRGLTVQRQKVSLPASGFFETSFQTDAAGLTGTYNINVYLIEKARTPSDDAPEPKYLGATSVKVEEFQPDQMKITTALSKPAPKGWLHPEDLRGNITLMNLYGTPATQRRITGTLTLRPVYPALAGFTDYTFFNPLKFDNVQTEELSPQETAADGTATFDFALNRFARATYRLEFLARGFAAEGGRSVESSIAALVSPLDVLIGYKPDASLVFLPRGSQHTVQVVAVDQHLATVEQKQLRAELIRKRYISTLIEQQDGTLKYQSVLKEEVVTHEEVHWPASGWQYVVPTTEAGDFVLRLYDADRTLVTQIPFAVAGATNLTRSLDRSAELELVLDRESYQAGDTITLQIEAPYAGSGLITIERDRLYTQQWFRTDTPTTVQSVRIPKGLEGDAYINVAFVRAANSKEIYVSPLSYGVVPFTVAHDHRQEGITLGAPDLARPGEEVAITYQTARPTQLVVWAVDEGILQFAGYPTPEPLEDFFLKRALEVRTFQTLDLIMPEYALYQQTAAAGGDQSYKFLGNNLNPFRRRTEPPVAFWSGIVDSGPDSGAYRFRVPDSFDGTLRIMAVAVNDDHIGAAELSTTVRGPFIISPTLPLFAAPGDRFQVSAIVANQVEGSGSSASVALTASGSSGLRGEDALSQSVIIPEGQERAVHFDFNAGEQLGNQTVQLTAQLGDATRTASTSLSVRPAAAYQTTILTGMSDKSSVTVEPTRHLYADLRTQEFTAAALPFGVGRGLTHYLADYPYACTEQLTSQSFAALAAHRHPELNVWKDAPADALTRMIGRLRSRQLGNGAFRYWPAAMSGGEGDSDALNDPTSRFASLYAAHLLFELPDAFKDSSQDMRTRARQFLRQLLEEPIEGMTNAHLYAYATYLLTRSGEVTTNYLANLLQYLDERADDDWQQSIIGRFVASIHQLMKQAKEAERFRKAYVWQTGNADAASGPDDVFFLSPASQDALAMYLLAKHFPIHAKKLSAEELHHLVQPLEAQAFNTVSAAYGLLALSALAHTTEMTRGRWTFEFADAEKHWTPLSANALGVLTVAPFGDTTTALRVRAQDSQPIFYQTVQRGFDRDPISEARNQGLEITRLLTDATENAVTSVAVGDAVTIRLRVRALDNAIPGTIVVVDLLPAGLEIRDADALRHGVSVIAMSQPWRVDYADIREDRAVLYGTATSLAAEFAYETRAVSPGTFHVPPIFAESMYHPTIQSRGVTGTITVVPAAEPAP